MILKSNQATTAFLNGTGSQLPATNSATYMSVSAGQYATVDRFAFTQKLFGADSRVGQFGIYQAGLDLLADFLASNGGVATINDLLTSNNADAKLLKGLWNIDDEDIIIGLTQPIELIADYASGRITKSDFVDLTYVYGTSRFGLNPDAIITLINGSPVVNNIGVVPISDDFDFVSTGGEAVVFNKAWTNDIAPNGGNTFAITYNHGAGTLFNSVATLDASAFNNSKNQTTAHKADLKSAALSLWAQLNDVIYAKLHIEAPDYFPANENDFDFDIGPLNLSSWNDLAVKNPSAATRLITAHLTETELEVDLGIQLSLGDLVEAYTATSWKAWFALDKQCFPAHTPVALADGTNKPISDIRVGDEVLSFKADGSLVAGTVDKLFGNTTQEFVKLSFDDGRDDLVATPGHRFLTETGDFMEIGQMLRLSGGTNSVRLVDKDGSIVTASGKVLAYSEETADLFEQSQMKATIMDGNLATRHEVEGGWATYNFEVREYHTYIAGDVRVHNDSVLSFLEQGDTLYSLDNVLENAAVTRDTNGDGKKEVVILDGDRPDPAGDTILMAEWVFTPTNPNADVDALLAQYIEANPQAASNVFDPGLGNIPGDGIPSDDIMEILTDDIGGTFVRTAFGVTMPSLQSIFTANPSALPGLLAGAIAAIGDNVKSTIEYGSGDGDVSKSVAAIDALQVLYHALGIRPADQGLFQSAFSALSLPTLDKVEIDFGTGITAGQLTQARSGDDLVFEIANTDGTTNALTVAGVYADGNASEVTAVNFADGTTFLLGSIPDTSAGGGSGTTATNGDANDNVLVGNGLDNVLNGFAGNDMLTGNGGNDILNGGTGFDTANYAGGISEYTHALSGGGGTITHNASGEVDQLADIEFIEFAGGGQLWVPGANTGSDNPIAAPGGGGGGGGTSTTVDGDNNANTLNGDPASNVLNGYAGNDTLNGKGGGDVLNGGTGFDTAKYDGAILDYTHALSGGGGTITHNATGEVDQLADIEFIEFAGGGQLWVPGADVNSDNPIAAPGGGSPGQTVFNGTSGDDIALTGNSLDNTINGYAGDDWLSGLEGDDILNAGLGDDYMVGGTGNDTFNGQGGFDKMLYFTAISEYTHALNGDGTGTITHIATGDVDTFEDIDQVVFNDITLWA